MLDPDNPYYNNAYVQGLFNDSFFSDLEYTSQWGNAISDAIDAVRKSVKDVSSLVNQVSTKEMFKSALTSSYMNQASIIARKKAQTFNSLYSDNSLVIKGRGSLGSSTTTTTPTLDDLIEDTKTMNPITSVESLKKVSKIIFEAMDK